MKIFFFNICIFILSSPIYCEILDANSLVDRDGLFYNQITNKLFSGFVEFKYDNGKLRAKGSFKMGKEEGYWEDFNENGTPFSKGFYMNGSPHGEFKFYHENGNLEEEGKFILGLKEGNWNTYWDNGNLKRQGKWKNGKAEGLFKFFNIDGKVIKIEIWNNGKKIQIIFEINNKNVSYKIGENKINENENKYHI